MTNAARFRQSDVTRAIKGAVAAGMRVGKFEIDANGHIVIWSASDAGVTRRNTMDEILGR